VLMLFVLLPSEKPPLTKSTNPVAPSGNSAGAG
jgi:hypothetical protein